MATLSLPVLPRVRQVSVGHFTSYYIDFNVLFVQAYDPAVKQHGLSINQSLQQINGALQ